MNWLEKILHRVSIATVVLVACSGMVAYAQSAQSGNEAYKVTDVPVDVTADNAVHARDQAILAGQVQALQILLTRLTAANPPATLPMPSPESVQNMVLAVSVSGEKRSSVRYIAKLTVQFVPIAVQKLLSEANVQYSANFKTVIILPVFRDVGNATPVLWEEPNPWRAIWAKHGTSGLLKLEVPTGDLDDIQAFDANKGDSIDAAPLQAMAQRYGASDSVIVTANMGETGVVVVARRSDGNTVQVIVRSITGETRDTLLGRAADAIATAMQGDWKPPVGPTVASASSPTPTPAAAADGTAVNAPAGSASAANGASPDAAAGSQTSPPPVATIADNTPAQDLVVLVPIHDMAGWLSIKSRLATVPAVRGVDVQAMASDRVQAVLHYGGTEAALNDLVTQHGLALESTGTFWLLKDATATGAKP